MNRRLLCLLVLFLASFPLLAQVKTVTGKVTDEKGVPLPGVSIVVKGTSKGTSTDFDGNYTLRANEGETIEFSFVGFTTQTKKVAVGGGNPLKINILLKEDMQQLSEVVVVGFGTQKKENLTGSVATVDTKILESRPVNNAILIKLKI